MLAVYVVRKLFDRRRGTAFPAEERNKNRPVAFHLLEKIVQIIGAFLGGGKCAVRCPRLPHFHHVLSIPKPRFPAIFRKTPPKNSLKKIREKGLEKIVAGLRRLLAVLASRMLSAMFAARTGRPKRAPAVMAVDMASLA